MLFCNIFVIFFYRNHEGKILKYSIYCIKKDCKTLASYNYEKLKPIYCNKHKFKKMINAKRNHKLCEDCQTGYLNKCITPSFKYTIKNYKNSSKYIKLKIIKYLKENNIDFLCAGFVDKLLIKNILIVKNI